MNASSKYCYSCNDWLASSKFDLIREHNPQTCKECAAKEKAKTANQIYNSRRCAYEERKANPKAIVNIDDPHAKKRKEAIDDLNQHARDKAQREEFEL